MVDILKAHKVIPVWEESSIFLSQLSFHPNQTSWEQGKVSRCSDRFPHCNKVGDEMSQIYLRCFFFQRLILAPKWRAGFSQIIQAFLKASFTKDMKRKWWKARPTSCCIDVILLSGKKKIKMDPNTKTNIRQKQDSDRGDWDKGWERLDGNLTKTKIYTKTKT